MFALIAAIILFLHGVWALHFALSWGLPVGGPWRRD